MNKAIIFILVVLFFIFNNEVHDIQIKLLSNLMELIIDNDVINNKIMITSHYRLSIEPECDGFELFLVSLLLILLKNGQLRIIFYSYMLVTIINVFRIYIIVVSVNFSKDLFFISHNIIGLILTVIYFLLIVWLLHFINREEIKKEVF